MQRKRTDDQRSLKNSLQTLNPYRFMLCMLCHAALQRKRKDDSERKSKHAEERERIKLALEDDRLQRQVAQELTAARPHPAQ
jgi:hypothetical protein